MKALLGALLILPGVLAAQQTRGTPVPDEVFATWVQHAQPSPIYFAVKFGVDGPRVDMNGMCAWQPMKDALLLAVHVDCARLTQAMESR